jgi:signal peptidase
MEPAIHAGSLVIEERVDPVKLAEGDVITYRRAQENTAVTHRITDIQTVNGAPTFTTKGDANNADDQPPLSFGSRVDVARYEIPYAGYILEDIQSPGGLLLLFGVPILGYAILKVLQMPGPSAGIRTGPQKARENERA